MVAAFNQEVGPLVYRSMISGKWRRYFSLNNFLDLFKIFAAGVQSFKILADLRPDLVVSAGSFVSVPLAWAASLRGIPVLIHQQDVRPGLANKLMAPIARAVTVTFEKSLHDYGVRAVWTGNPVRIVAQQDQAGLAEVRNKYNLNSALPLVVVTGGGTGSVALNELVAKSVPGLCAVCQIVHLTGTGKASGVAVSTKNYQVQEFIASRNFLNLLAAADLVISRCGLSVLTELSALRKPAILIPLPDSHQVDNAAVFAQAQAAIVLEQKDLSPDILIREVQRVLADAALRSSLANNISKIIKRGAAEAIAGIIWEMIK
jgi:UDP-N-acetylglucosamine--N-acetylmuramyl-(pentapeptide) pyrophosphoryl-undecaprenol N-acetylglucosamine transferase